jgi:hypothetical protein
MRGEELPHWVRRLPALAVHERQKQFHGVAVGGDGPGTGLALLGQPVGEEQLQRRCDQGHDRYPDLAADQAAFWRSAASASSSGDAERYQ